MKSGDVFSFISLAKRKKKKQKPHKPRYILNPLKESSERSGSSKLAGDCLEGFGKNYESSRMKWNIKTCNLTVVEK